MTTVTRMVEEERPIIACLKSLGMSDGKITFKYLFLTIICCIISVAVGLSVGFAVLPTVIYPAFETMFYMPPMSGNLYPMMGILAFVAMTAVVLSVTYAVCRASLHEKPAQLLTAKAPKAGKRIWLEYLPFLWKPLSFKYKSSIRNIFRYKKHLIMTVLSVAGSTALAFAGFAILDVTEALAESGGSFVGMKDSVAAIAVVVIIFALLLCVFVIYNLTNLNVSERKKEIATLDVLGYHSKERLGYIYREIVMMATVGAIVGIGLGMALVAFVLEYLDFGSVWDAQWTAYVFSFALVMLFVVITDLLLIPKVLKIDMTTSLGKDIEKWMRRKCTVKVGSEVYKEDIDKSVSIYYGTSNYSSITYTLHEDPLTENGYILRFKFVDKPSHDFGVGFRFDTQDLLSVFLRVGINSNRISGFKTDFTAKLGGNQWLNTKISYGHMLYPRINLSYNFRNSEIDAYDMDQLTMNMKFLQHKFRLFLSENYSRTYSAGAGFEVEFLTPNKVMYTNYDTVDWDYKAVNTLGTFAYFHFDNLNKSSFPTRGVRGNIDFSWKDMQFTTKGTEGLGYGSLVFGFEGYVPIIEDRLVMIPQVYASVLFGKGSVNGTTNGWMRDFLNFAYAFYCNPHLFRNFFG